MSLKKFAEAWLNNHLEEINTLYENKKPDFGEKNEAIKAHQRIFEEELNNKIKKLHPDNTKELDTLKSEYLNKLK